MDVIAVGGCGLALGLTPRRAVSALLAPLSGIENSEIQRKRPALRRNWLRYARQRRRATVEINHPKGCEQLRRVERREHLRHARSGVHRYRPSL
jgi:hypothetical protein